MLQPCCKQLDFSVWVNYVALKPSLMIYRKDKGDKLYFPNKHAELKTGRCSCFNFGNSAFHSLTYYGVVCFTDSAKTYILICQFLAICILVGYQESSQ